MKILVINSGSSSLKYSLFDKEKNIAEGIVDRIGQPASKIKDHIDAIRKVMENLKEEIKGIDAIGHRVVHGGSYFYKPEKINKDVIKKIKKCFDLAPLHNPPTVLGIDACAHHFKDIPQVAVFDTAYHHNIPEKAYTYALPKDICSKYNIRRYGFHGTSHEYVAREAAKILGRRFDKLKIISCHLGNGASITAIEDGKSIDTSMGFTPLEGLVMGTRCGDIDPAIVDYLIKKGYSNDNVYKILNEKSGLFGISGVSSDVRVLNKSKNKNAKLALDVFCYRIKKYIGAYAAALSGVDVIIFTAGIGENAHQLRMNILEDLEFLGVRIDKSANSKNKIIISTKKSKVIVLVIHTDEDLMIAKSVNKILN